MPLTVPTHPVAVLPLKLWRPRWFDGVALVMGAIAPDIAYAADGYGLTIHSHFWSAVFWWGLPVALVAVRLTRWAAPAVAAHLPGGGALRLRDYGVLGAVRHPWQVTVLSAMIGAASHLAWDTVTHPFVDGGGVPLPVLHREAVFGWPWWYLIRNVSDLIGLIAGISLVAAIGRARLLRRWHGAPPAVAPRPAVFWPVASLILVGGLALLPVQPVLAYWDQAIRAMLVGGAALLGAAAAVRLRARWAQPGRTGSEGRAVPGIAVAGRPGSHPARGASNPSRDSSP